MRIQGKIIIGLALMAGIGISGIISPDPEGFIQEDIKIAYSENMRFVSEWNQAKMEEQIDYRKSMKPAGSYRISAYTIYDAGCDEVTATGAIANPGVTIASDWKKIRPGTWVHIEDIGWRQVQDCGGAIKKNRIDLLMGSKKEAFAFGMQDKEVIIYERN